MKKTDSFLPDPAPLYCANCSDGTVHFDDIDMLQLCKELGLPLYIRYDHHQETVDMLLKLYEKYDALRVKYENLIAMFMGSGVSSDEANLKIKEYLSEIKE